MAPTEKPLRVVIVGLGIASTQVAPAFINNADFELVAGVDVRPDARADFEARTGRPTVKSIEDLVACDDVDAVWIATPNTLHAEHSILAAEHGKHIICEKPIAVTLDECDRMIAAAEKNNVRFLQGHSKIYQAPIRKMREIIKSGALGRVLQIQAVNYNDWLQRPRLPAELDTSSGGGIVYRQGPHIVDIVRVIGGGLVKNIRGTAGKADPNFDAFGHFNALLEFEDCLAASVTFNGYGYFDITELTWDIGEGGQVQAGSKSFPGTKPRLTALADPDSKSAAAKTMGIGAHGGGGARRQPFFGLTVVLCERGVLRQSPDGLYVYTEDGRQEVPCGTSGAREAELSELATALKENRPAFPDGRWGKATLEVCLGIMESARTGGVIEMKSQVSAP